MSQESEFSEDNDLGWIQWFCGLDDHQFFCEVDEQFIKQKFNLYGLKNRIKRFEEALLMILRKNGPQEDEIENPKYKKTRLFLQVYQQATDLYGLIHARYITTPLGLANMREYFLQGRFGQCPRVLCEKQNAIPIGISEDLKLARVKIYCPRCCDIYSPKKKLADVDGAFFGTSFPQLLLMTYPDIKPLFKKENYQPRIFGFKVIEQNNKKQQMVKIEQPPTEESSISKTTANKKKKR